MFRRHHRSRFVLCLPIQALTLIATLAIAAPAHSQNWSFDARDIALGSTAHSDNLAFDTIAEANGYRAIVLPFGLFQVLADIDVFSPSSDEFDFVRAMENVASPIHYTFGRHSTSSGRDFSIDLRNAELDRDLNVYRGFVPVNQPRAEGLAAPQWGYTFPIQRTDGRRFHGLYVGAGPYVSMRSDLSIDDRLIGVLEASSPAFVPNAQLRSSTSLRAQLAAAVAVGYRGRYAVPGATDDRDGVYVAVNYDVLRGIRYEDLDVALRLDTDPRGLLVVNTQLPPPLLIARNHSTSGSGRAVDVGIGFVERGWETGFGARGIGNRIDWKEISRTTYGLGNPLTGNAEFDEATSRLAEVTRVTLPIAYTASLAFNPEGWTAIGNVGWGLGGPSVHGGYERRWNRFSLRGGANYARQLWSPTGGIGLNLSPHTGLDIGLYGNGANAERKRHLALAVSIRLGPGSVREPSEPQARN